MNDIIFFMRRKFYSLRIAYEVLIDNINLFIPNKKLLVIGMAPSGLFQGVIPELKQISIIPDVVELNPDHANWIRVAHKLKVFNMDAVDFDNFDDYDTVLWVEGPEHVSKEDFFKINNKIKRANFIIECPYGDAPEDSGEVGLKHVSGWKPQEFKQLNFNTLLSSEIYCGNSKPLICGFKLRKIV